MADLIEKLRELLKTATRGPWHPGHLGDEDQRCQCTGIVDEGYAGGIASVHVSNGIPSVAHGGNDAPPKEEAAANMKLICEMRNSIEPLLDCAEVLSDIARGLPDCPARDAANAALTNLGSTPNE